MAAIRLEITMAKKRTAAELRTIKEKCNILIGKIQDPSPKVTEIERYAAFLKLIEVSNDGWLGTI